MSLQVTGTTGPDYHITYDEPDYRSVECNLYENDNMS